MSSAERSIALVGGGFAGVGAAAMLRRAGHHDVTVFERAERVGGVWQANTDPGAACDIPSHLYEFSFAPNPCWSRRYAPQAEIQAYLEDVARGHDVRTGTEVTAARRDGARWQLETSAGPHEADGRSHRPARGGGGVRPAARSRSCPPSSRRSST